MSETAAAEGGTKGGAGGRGLGRATLAMAAGTAVSRLTGVGRIVALAYALGFHHLVDAYNLANTTPNMLYDIVLGGVLSATFIPVFVDRLSTRSPAEAWRAISAVVTLAMAVLAAATVAFWLLAPFLIDAFTAFGHTAQLSAATLASERAVAVDLLRWFVPQVFFYGLFSLATALLNARQRFGAPTWVPVANNLVCIAVLLWFRHVEPNPSLHSALSQGHQLVLLGVGTTAGVLVQALLLAPSYARAGLGRVRLHWDPGHEAVRTVLRLGLWTFGFVVANQIALY
ncbi:MAG: lipid II flippase MurJ, partial [Acidimicrobiales bacterium]